MQIIVTMCLCEIISSFATYVYTPISDGPWCTAQAFLWMYFRRATWLWATMIPICLYCSLQSNPLQFRTCNIIVWLTNTLIAILPICVGVHYGGSSGGEYLCFFENTKAGLKWFAYTMVLVGTICPFLSILILVILEFEMKSKFLPTDDFGKAIRSLISKNIGYPVCLFVCWTPFNVSFLALDVVNTQPHENSQVLILLSTFALTSLFGLAIGFVFFTKSPEARQRWAHLLGCWGAPSIGVTSNDGDPNGNLMSRDSMASDFGADSSRGYSDSAMSNTQTDTLCSLRDSAFSSYNPMSPKSGSSEDRIVSGDISITNLRLHSNDSDVEDRIPGSHGTN